MTENFDVIIIGGGSVGVGIFRDLSLHGIKTLLLEQKDFSSQTSQSSSKMLHGGIRYLENYDFPLVREALHEKNLWVKLAPNLVKEIPFCLPVYKESKYPLWMTSIGLKVYDALSGFKNQSHKVLNKKNTLQILPSIKKKGLKGAGFYYDAIVNDHKLILECLYDALLAKKSKALNYHKVTEVKKNNKKYLINAQNTLSKENRIFKAKKIIFATGPFTDNLLIKDLKMKWTPQMILSKGSHIWLKHQTLDIKNSIVLQTKDNRVIFVIPQDKGILVGTTETPIDEDIFDIKASQKEIDYLLKTLKEYFPKVNIMKKDILATFAGVRPLVKASNKNAHKASRHHKIYSIGDDISVIIGGKYTTFRVMGQKLTKKIVKYFGKEYNSKKTLAPLRKKSEIGQLNELKNLNKQSIENILKDEYVGTFEDLIVRRLSIESKKMWEYLTETSFDDFFTGHLSLMNKYIDVSVEDIKNFK